MFAVGAGDEKAGRSDGRSEPLMTQGRFRDADVAEGRVAEHDVELPARPSAEVREDVGHDDLGPLVEFGRREITTEGFHGLCATLHEGRSSRSARQRLYPEGPCAGEQIENSSPFE